MTLSELNKFEYLSPPLKKNKLRPKRMANTKAIFDFPMLLNINIVASIIIVSIREIIMINLSSFSSYFIANWKLNGDFKFIDQFVEKLRVPEDSSKCTVICPTSIHLEYLSRKAKKFFLGAQNVSQYTNGAYTGEISSHSLNELNIDFCIVGHSERRQIFNENNNDVNEKSSQLIKNQIIPIICIGESLDDRKNNKTNERLTKQIKEGLPENSNSDNTIIAYEPIWAIGSGLTPTLEEINQTHNFIKNHEVRLNNYKILYGGSVKPDNAKEIVSLSNVDGLLIGGASLKYDDFQKIIKY